MVGMEILLSDERLEDKLFSSVEDMCDIYNARIYDEKSLNYKGSISEKSRNYIKNYINGLWKLILKDGKSAYFLLYDILPTMDEVKKNLVLSDIFNIWNKKISATYIIGEPRKVPLHLVLNSYKLTAIYYASKAYREAKKKSQKYHALSNILDSASWMILHTNIFRRSTIFFELKPLFELVVYSYDLIKRIKVNPISKLFIDTVFSFVSWKDRAIAYEVSHKYLKEGPFYEGEDCESC